MLPSDDPVKQQVNKVRCSYYRDYLPPDENCMEPMSSWYYPILENTDSIKVADDGSTSDYPLRGLLTATFYWRTVMKNILPTGSDGIILVVNNTCSLPFTYRINGPTVEFVNSGDQHDTKYNYLTERSTASNLRSYFQEESQYSGLPIENETCTTTFDLYPSEEMEDRKSNALRIYQINFLLLLQTLTIWTIQFHYAGYHTNKGIVFAISAAAFIIFPFLLFVVYDRKVTRQKELIIDTAERSDAIISSLFPSHVHDKLLEMETKNTVMGLKPNVGPIADLYPDTTVLFAGKQLSNTDVHSPSFETDQIELTSLYCLNQCLLKILRISPLGHLVS